jgi:hypothetical protein
MTRGISKDGPAGLRFSSRLKVVEIGVDQDGDLLTSCVVEPVEAHAVEINSRQSNETVNLKKAILATYDRLADGRDPSPSIDGARVRKVGVDQIRDEVKSRGYLDVDERGHLTSTSRSLFRKAKTGIIASGKLFEAEGLIWRP